MPLKGKLEAEKSHQKVAESWKAHEHEVACALNFKEELPEIE